MDKSYVSSVINAPVAKVWGYLREFDAVATYLPGVKRVELSEGAGGDRTGVVRTIIRTDNEPSVRERLLALSDVDRSCSYALVDDPALPLRNYIAHVRLLPITDGNRTFIEWRSEYEITGDPVAVHHLVEHEVYLTIMRSLQRLCA